MLKTFMLKQKKSAAFAIIYIIYITIIALLCSAALSSCGNDPDNGREAFAPDSGAYKIMLKTDQWNVVRVSDNIDTLALQNIGENASNVTVITECYRKSNVADVNVSDFDSFIKFYKLFDYVKGPYENEDNTVEEAVDMSEKEIKNTQIKTGKRQKIYIDPDLVLEYVYFETADHYFVVNFTVQTENYTDDVIKAVNEVIFNIRKPE